MNVAIPYNSWPTFRLGVRGKAFSRWWGDRRGVTKYDRVHDPVAVPCKQTARDGNKTAHEQGFVITNAE